MVSNSEKNIDQRAAGTTFHPVTSQPEKVGKYIIQEEIGRGSMGTVYSANDPFSSRQVAIKVAHTHFITSSDEGERFR